MSRNSKRIKIYIAGPLKFETTRIILDEIEKLCQDNGFDTWSPYKDAGLLSNDDLDNPKILGKVLDLDIRAFHECSGAIFLLDGLHSGTLFELGYAYYIARNISPNFLLIGLYTSIRKEKGLDSMVKFAFKSLSNAYIVFSLKELASLLSDIKEKLSSVRDY